MSAALTCDYLTARIYVIFHSRRRTSKPIWHYFPFAIVGQKVKLHEHYFQLGYIETVVPMVPVGSYHQSMKPLVH